MKHPFLTCACVAALEFLAATAVRAQAAEEAVGPVLALHVDAALEHDSNILRAADAVSDDIGILSAGIRLDKRYSLQRLTLQAQAQRYRFRDYANLDYSTLAYDGAWNFQFTPHLRGVLSAERQQYRDITNVASSSGVNLRTERHERAEATLLGRGGWRTLAGLAHDRSRSDDPRALESSPRVTSLYIGAGHEFASGTLMTAQVRRGDGHYGAGAGSIDFRETEPSLTLHWPATAKTLLDARVGYLDRTHDQEAARDFKGFVGNSTLRWDFSPRTRFEAALSRDLGSYEFSGGGQIRGWRLSLAPVWKPSEKTALRLRHAMERRTWRVVSPLAPDAGRKDRNRWDTLAFEWTPWRLLEMTASVRQERRNSNLPGLDFRAHIVTLGARLNF